MNNYTPRLGWFSIFQIVRHDSANQEIVEALQSQRVGFLCPVIVSAGLRDAEIGVWGWDTGGNPPNHFVEPLGGSGFARARSLQLGAQASFYAQKTIPIYANFAGGSHSRPSIHDCTAG